MHVAVSLLEQRVRRSNRLVLISHMDPRHLGGILKMAGPHASVLSPRQQLSRVLYGVVWCDVHAQQQPQRRSRWYRQRELAKRCKWKAAPLVVLHTNGSEPKDLLFQQSFRRLDVNRFARFTLAPATISIPLVWWRSPDPSDEQRCSCPDGTGVPAPLPEMSFSLLLLE